MKEVTDQAFVLRVGHFREIDLWLKLLVPEIGLVTAFAFGGAKSRRRFCGCLDVFNILTCRLRQAKSGPYLTLEEAQLVRAPEHLRRDYKRTGLAANCLRFLEAFGVAPENAADVFVLLQEMCSRLEKPDEVASLFPLFFRLKLAAHAGYRLEFSACGMCGEPLHGCALFVVNEGFFVCERCRSAVTAPPHLLVSTSKRERALLSSVQENGPLLWTDADYAPYEKRVCSMSIDGFIQYHLGIVWERGAFRRV